MLFIYSFQPSGLSTEIIVEYDEAARVVRARTADGSPMPRVVTDGENGYEEDEIIETFCDGPDYIIIRARSSRPFGRVVVIENSPQCPVVIPNPTPDPEPEPEPDPGNPPERLVYRMHWQNFEGDNLYLDIIDRQNYNPQAPEKVIGLEAAGDPVTISIVDNEEYPLSPIRAKVLTARFLSTDGPPAIGLSDFIEGEDNRWQVVHYKDDTLNILFMGFLTFSDAQEPFLPAPCVVELTATDNIGLLKDVPLTDRDGKTPRGPNKIMHYIAWALHKTGMSLQIQLVHNLREENSPTLPMYESCKVDAKTFEDEVGKSISCYEVLERILGEDAFLEQCGAAWWIVRPDEMNGGQYTAWVFNHTGALESGPVQITAQYSVQEGTDRWFSGEAANVLINRPHREVKLTYSYDYPKEILDNIDFSRGAPITPLGGVDWQAFAVDDWTYVNYLGDKDGLPYPLQAYIRRDYFEGYEKDRYVVLPYLGGDNWAHLVSKPIPIMEKDRFKFSVDWKPAQDVTSTYGENPTATIAQIRLYANDGTFWALHAPHNEKPIWKQSINGTFGDIPGGANVLYTWANKEVDAGLIHSVSVDTATVPRTGQLEIRLWALGEFALTQRWYSNLRFDYRPYINGSYGDFSGQYNRLSQTGKYQSAYESSVYLGDSPRILFKGALLRYNGTKHVLAGKFFHPDYPGYLQPYGWWQTYAVWYLKKRVMRLIEGDLRGLDLKNGMADCVHQWLLMDQTAHTTGKVFMLLHYDMSHQDCGGQAVFHEVSDFAHEKTFSDPHEFRYVEKR